MEIRCLSVNSIMNREDLARRSRTDAARRQHPHLDRSYVIPVLSKALLIMDLLRNSERPLNVAEIAGNTGISKSTVYRILRTLSAYGYLPEGASGIYSFRPVQNHKKQAEQSEKKLDLYNPGSESMELARDYIQFQARCISRQSLGGTPSQVRNARPNEFGSSKPSRYAASFNSNTELER